MFCSSSDGFPADEGFSRSAMAEAVAGIERINADSIAGQRASCRRTPRLPNRAAAPVGALYGGRAPSAPEVNSNKALESADP